MDRDESPTVAAGPAPEPEESWHPLTRMLTKARDEQRAVELGVSESKAIVGVPLEVMSVAMPLPCVVVGMNGDTAVVPLAHLLFVNLADEEAGS